MKSCQIENKRGVVGLMWPIFECTSVDLEKFCHGTSLSEINNAVDGLPLLLTAIEGRCQWCYTLRLKLYRFVLLLYMLQSCLYNMSTTNRPSGSSCPLTKSVKAIDGSKYWLTPTGKSYSRLVLCYLFLDFWGIIFVAVFMSPLTLIHVLCVCFSVDWSTEIIALAKVTVTVIHCSWDLNGMKLHKKGEHCILIIAGNRAFLVYLTLCLCINFRWFCAPIHMLVGWAAARLLRHLQGYVKICSLFVSK